MTDRVRAVLAGCGGISNAWLKGAQSIEGLEIVGLVDIIRDAAERRAEQYNLQNAAIDTDLAAMLDQVQPDVVFNCTIPSAHREVTLAGLEHGCHVLSEKPLADSMDSARELVAVAEQADRLFAVIQNRRYDPNIRRLRSG